VLILSSSSRTGPDAATSVARAYVVTTTAPTVPVSVTRAGTGGGTVASSPGSIFCGDFCSGSFALGTTVTLGAVPDKSSTFSGWSGACSGSAVQCVLTPDDAATITATFTAIPRPPASQTSALDQELAADGKAPRLGFAKPKLSRSKLSLRVTCPATERHRCSGFVTIVAHAGKKRLNLGQKAFLSLKGGARKVLAFPLSARSRSAIRRVHKIRLVISARTRDDAFNYSSQRRKVTLNR
jgi:hypothetical protein